jgi:Flp pilus assembly protein TadG
MVEMALVLPLLLVLVLGAIQFGILFNDYETITDATRAGARQAILLRINGGNPNDAVQVVKNAATGLDWSKPGASVTVTSPDWTTPGTDVTVTTTYPYSVDLLGFVVSSGNLTSTMKERLE